MSASPRGREMYPMVLQRRPYKDQRGRLEMCDGCLRYQPVDKFTVEGWCQHCYDTRCKVCGMVLDSLGLCDGCLMEVTGGPSLHCDDLRQTDDCPMRYGRYRSKRTGHWVRFRIP